MIMVLKFLILSLLLLITSWIGIILSKKYSNRVKELRQIKSSLNIIENEIKFTYKPIPDIFKELSKKFTGSVGEIFRKSYENMLLTDAGIAWENAIEVTNSNLKQEDKESLKALGKLLGKTDVEGQVSQLNLIGEFINVQLESAQQEQVKGEKLYKKLGVISGLMIVVALI